MRIGQSIWSRDDFNLNNSTSSKSSIKFQSDTDTCRSLNFDDDRIEEEVILPHGNLINSSKKLFLNKHLRNRIYEQHQRTLNDGTFKTIYHFRATRISIDDDGPFWPMAFPIKHPTPSFLSLIRNQKKSRCKEYYISRDNYFLGLTQQQTFDNQPAVHKYTDVLKRSTIIYDMDKSPRQQQPKTSESEQTCPSLIFESRFEGGNLRQVKRV
jgi:hypothetical protein